MTTQALPSFDAEYARVLKAAESAQALAHDREMMINAANAALDAAGVARDLPLAGRVAALVGEIAHVKQSMIDALQSVDQEQRAGAQFDNILLAVAARCALAWLDDPPARAAAALDA